MPDILATAAAVDAIAAAVALAVPTIPVDGADVPVVFLNRPPQNWLLGDEDLPQIYVYCAGETVQKSGVGQNNRAISVDVVLLANDRIDPKHILNPMQLSVERALIAAAGDGAGLGAIAHDVQLISVALHTDQGRTLFGVRLMRYDVQISVTANDPAA